MIRIPTDFPYKQVNRGDTEGSLWSTFNCDFQGNHRKLRAKRSKLTYSNTNDSDFRMPLAFAYFESAADSSRKFWCITDDYVWKGGVEAQNTFTQDSTTSTPTNVSPSLSDMKVFNNALVVATADKIVYLTSVASAWANADTSGVANSFHSMDVYGDRLYYANAYTTIRSLDTAWAVATPGSDYAIDLEIPEKNLITFIRAGANRIWIGTLNSTGGNANIYEWDGISPQTDRAFQIDANGALACVIFEDVPHIIDTKGRLLAYNGGQFMELARLPVLEGQTLKGANADDPDERFIHPNGMTIVDGKINILVRSTNNDSGQTTNENFPSGVWEYDVDKGLTHKVSASYSPAGAVTLTDYGQHKLHSVGALMSAAVFDAGQTPTSSKNGSLLFGATYYTDATTTKYGVFVDDTLDTTQKSSVIVTTKISSSQLDETWKNVYTKNKKLLDASDSITVKYRTSDIPSTEATITWASVESFTTTSDLSAYAVGDEVEILQGIGGGFTAHITAIASAAGTYTVTLDSPPSGVTGTAIARFQKWKKAGIALSNQNVTWAQFGLDQTSSWIQLKIQMVFKGKDELEEIIITNEANTQAI